MYVSRRELIVLTGAIALEGCAAAGLTDSAPARHSPAAGPVDAGLIDAFEHDGVYERFRDSHDFFIIRQGPRLFAQSAICTHRDCTLARSADGFRCKCHGSTFTVTGQVTKGPAQRDLPRLAVERDLANHLIVHAERPLILPDAFDAPDAFITLS